MQVDDIGALSPDLAEDRARETYTIEQAVAAIAKANYGDARSSLQLAGLSPGDDCRYVLRPVDEPLPVYDLS